MLRDHAESMFALSGRHVVECPVMLARSMIIAVTLAAGTAASAEPPKAQVQQAAQPSSRPIVLASAEATKAPAPATDQQAPPKPARAARVTSCRCGDPVPQEDDSEL
jgi:hypothetical protein